MKRKSLFNRIISLSIIAALYLSMSASAYAELDGADEPVVAEEQVAESEPAAENAVLGTAAPTSEEPAAAADEELNAEAPPPGNGETPAEGDGEKPGETIVDKIVDAVENLVNPDETPKAEGEETAEGEDKADKPEGAAEGEGKVETPEGEADKEKTEKEKAEDVEKPEPEVGDTYFIITTNEDGTAVKATYEYVINEETGELEAILKEEIKGKFDEDGNLIDEEKEKCKHEYIYTSTKDGKHTVKCKNCDMEEFTESCEFDEKGVCKKCGWKRLPDPILIYEDDEVIVTVKGAVPENADLKVTPIKKDAEETKEAFEAVEQKLIDKTDIEEADSYGFLAYDICFVNIETGEEVEPTDDVTVSMEYKQAFTPVTETLEGDVETDVDLIHFNEETDELENLTDDGQANLELDDSKAITKAEFTSDSFSTYVIKWENTINTRYVKIITSCYAKNGEELTEFSTDEITHKISGSSVGNENIIANYASAIDGYKCVKAEYKYNDKYYEVDTFKYYYNSGTKQIKVCKGDDQIGSNIDLVGTLDNAKKIYITFTYEKDAALSVLKKATGDAAVDEDTKYVFQLFAADGTTPLSGKEYFIGKTKYTTDAEGKFLLKTGESADFAPSQIPAGEYKISETGVDSTTYTMNDFLTKVSIDGETKETYNVDFNGKREVAATVAEGSCTQVTYRNCPTVPKIELDKPESVSKYIRYDGEDRYDLSIKFTPPAYDISYNISEWEMTEESEPLNVDICLVIDKSGSMDDYVNGSDKDRIHHVKDAVETLRDVIKSKRNVNASWKVVYFGSSVSNNSDTVNSAWKTSDQLSINTSTGGATNYEAALKRARDITATKRSDTDKTIVIFITDGEPTYYDGWSGEGSTFKAKAYTNAKTVASQLKCDSFYTIGVDFKDTTFVFYENGVRRALTPAQILENITAAATNVPDKANASVNSKDVAALLKNLAGTITSKPNGADDDKVVVKNRAKNLVMKDTLSEYAEPKPGSDFYITLDVDGVSTWTGSGYDPTYVAASENGKIPTKQEDGTYTGGKDATFDVIDGGVTHHLTAVYDPNSKTVTLDFPDDYELNPNYSYIVVFDYIRPSDKAYEEFLDETKGYNAVGEVGTDHKLVDPDKWTSQDKDGFFSNVHDENAPDITFDYNGSKGLKRWFPMPVLQVHVKYEWELYKVDDSVDGKNKLGMASFQLKEAGTEGQETDKYTGTSSSDSDKTGLVTWKEGLNSVDKIPAGEYVLRESGALAGYVRSSEFWRIKIDEENKATVTVCSPDLQSEVSYEEAYADLIAAQESYEVPQKMAERDGNVITYKFYFKNSPMGETYTLPNTGGNGIYRTTALGVALMLTSVFLFYRNKKRTKTFYEYRK